MVLTLLGDFPEKILSALPHLLSCFLSRMVGCNLLPAAGGQVGGLPPPAWGEDTFSVFPVPQS